MDTLYHIGCSGGKDSTALLLWAIYESGLPGKSLRATFCDTKNEDRLTYEHIAMLNKKVANVIGGIEALEPERGFFELAWWKRRFPSRKAQFCTHHLKLYPTKAWVEARQREGYEVVVMNGKRSAESAERNRAMRDTPERAWSDYWGCEEWAPLKEWKIEDVFTIHKRYGVPLNPLYNLGAHRVGCFPCINCGKREINLVAKHRPEKIDQIEEWENRFEQNYGRLSTFFTYKVATKPFRTKRVRNADGTSTNVAPIREIVKWAQTSRGGSQYRLALEEEPKACWMNYGACE